jgi:nicotinamide-nucleotide amidase
VDHSLRDLYRKPGLRVTILSHPGQLELHLLASGGEGEALVAEVEQEVHARLGDAVYGTGDATLSATVGRLLAERGETVATAESCTAGLVAAALTEAAGSSAWFRGGLIVYDDAVKHSVVGVNEETLARHGAVSEAVARELATGARDKLESDWGVGITGIAGPGGGSPDKPLGTVHIAVTGPSVEWHRRYLFHGDRGQIRTRTVNAALDILRRLAGGPA